MKTWIRGLRRDLGVKIRQAASGSSLAPTLKAAAHVRPFGAISRPRIILFIGHHKVGSTALQDYLARNAPLLSQHGILYPMVDFEGLAHVAARSQGLPATRDILPINVREPHNALSFRLMADRFNERVPALHPGLPAFAQMKRAIEQQVRFTDPHTIILASEVFSNFGKRDPDLIDRLMSVLPEGDVTLVAVFRQIDSYLPSWYGQRLRFGAKIDPLWGAGVERYFETIHFDYKLLLAPWIEKLPSAHLIVRDYADVLATGGSVADFLQQTNVAAPDGCAEERHRNPSLHRGLFELSRRANHAMERPQSEAFFRKLMRYGSASGLAGSREIELFGAAGRNRMVDQFTPIDRYLADVAGKPTGGFFTNLSKARAPLPVSEVEACKQAVDFLRVSGLPSEMAEFVEHFAPLTTDDRPAASLQASD